LHISLHSFRFRGISLNLAAQFFIMTHFVVWGRHWLLWGALHADRVFHILPYQHRVDCNLQARALRSLRRGRGSWRCVAGTCRCCPPSSRRSSPAGTARRRRVQTPIGPCCAAPPVASRRVCGRSCPWGKIWAAQQVCLTHFSISMPKSTFYATLSLALDSRQSDSLLCS
jgi:hypothetical protein